MVGNSAIIPIIDLQAPDSGQLIVQACEEWGCFRVMNFHGILEESLMREMKTVASEFLDLPHEIKAKNQSVAFGHVPPSVVNPLYESLGIGDFESTDKVEAFCSRMEATHRQRTTMLMYAKAVRELMLEIVHKIGQGLGIDITTTGDSFEDWACYSRINKYTFSPGTLGSPGLHLHSDSGFMTILQEDDSVGGLEVMTPSGELVTVDPCPGTFIINIGDIGRAWSNGRFLNAKHRVMCKEYGIRVTINSLLFGPKEGEVIKAPKELVDVEHPRMFVPFTSQDYAMRKTNKYDGEILTHFLHTIKS